MCGRNRSSLRPRPANVHDSLSQNLLPGIGSGPVAAADDRKSLETLDTIKSAYWKNPVMTVELAPGKSLKFTDIKRAGKSAALPDGGHLQVVFNSLKLQGTVTLSLQVEKNRDKVAAALKSAGKTREVTETEDGYRFTIRRGSSVSILPLMRL